METAGAKRWKPRHNLPMHLSVELDCSIGTMTAVLDLPSFMNYGETCEEAISSTPRLAIEVIESNTASCPVGSQRCVSSAQ